MWLQLSTLHKRFAPLPETTPPPATTGEAAPPAGMSQLTLVLIMRATTCERQGPLYHCKYFIDLAMQRPWHRAYFACVGTATNTPPPRPPLTFM